MNIFKKLFKRKEEIKLTEEVVENVKEENSILSEQITNNETVEIQRKDKIIEEINITEKSKEDEVIELNNEINSDYIIEESSITNDNISEYVDIVNEVEKWTDNVSDEFKEIIRFKKLFEILLKLNKTTTTKVDIETTNEVVKNIVEKEKLLLDQTNSSIEKDENNNNIKLMNDLLSIFNNTNILEAKELDINYENFYLLPQYKYTIELENIINFFKEDKHNTAIKNELDIEYSEFEKIAKNIIPKSKKTAHDVTVFSSEIENFRKEVEQFSITLAKAKSLSKIELKGQYDKLTRERAALLNKKEAYMTKEESLNVNIRATIKEQEVFITKFLDIAEYLKIYIKQELADEKLKNPTYTNDKTRAKIQEIKYSIEVLTNLDNILKIE